MRDAYIYLPSVEKVQQFVSTLAPLHGDFDIISDKFVLDARSLMGYFGFDITRPLQLKIYNDTPENLAAIRPFLANKEVQ